MERLDDQIAWYDNRSNRIQQFYKIMKITVIAIAALIPLLPGLQASMGVPPWVLGILGALIAIVEGIQQLNQYHANWISYRSACEALKHEKFLYLANAGLYAAATDPRVLLAERIEALASQEHAKCASSQEAKEKSKAPDVGG